MDMRMYTRVRPISRANPIYLPFSALSMDYVRAGVALGNPHCSGTYQARAEMKRLAIPLITAYIDPLYREVRMRIRIYSRRAQHATLSAVYVVRYVAELHSLDLYQATMVLGRAVAQMHSVALVAPLAALLERRLVFTSCAL